MGKPRTVDEAKVLTAYRETGSGPAVAERLGVAASSVYRVLARAGVPVQRSRAAFTYRPPRKFSEAIERGIAERYRAGELTAHLASEHGCSIWTVLNIARRHGVPIREVGGVPRQFSEPEIDEMVRMWKSGASRSAIGQKFGAHSVSISRWLRARGLRPRGRAQSMERHSNWKGGRVVTVQGYVMVRLSAKSPYAAMRTQSGYVLEHRLAMAKKLKRPLLRSEHVHHVNGDRADNRPGNLELWRGHHPHGVRAAAPHCPTCSCGLN